MKITKEDYDIKYFGINWWAKCMGIPRKKGEDNETLFKRLKEALKNPCRIKEKQ